METGGRPDRGVCAAVYVHYLRTGGARAAAVLAADAAFAQVLAERTAVLPWMPPCRPGQFYLRELPPLRAVLDDLSGRGLLAAGGCADLDPSGRPGRAVIVIEALLCGLDRGHRTPATAGRREP